jgi:hypothetical protein
MIHAFAYKTTLCQPLWLVRVARTDPNCGTGLRTKTARDHPSGCWLPVTGRALLPRQPISFSVATELRTTTNTLTPNTGHSLDLRVDHPAELVPAFFNSVVPGSGSNVSPIGDRGVKYTHLFANQTTLKHSWLHFHRLQRISTPKTWPTCFTSGSRRPTVSATNCANAAKNSRSWK